MGLQNSISSKLKSTQIIWVCMLAFMLYFVLNLAISYSSNSLNLYSYYSKNLLGLSLMYTGMMCGVLVFLLSDVKMFFKKSLNSLLLVIFIISIYFFMNESSVLNLFFIYELFLLPSFYLVYSLSPNRSSTMASMYFLTWTQFGSLLVLMAMVMGFYLNGGFYLNNSVLSQNTAMFWFLFIGFGMKMPMWPFYYWLTKTHVEASSFFSMYLSGFLVKTAVFLFMKFYSFYGLQSFYNLFLVLFIIGVIDSSMKMWHQTDLKKLMAYTTVQEMNFLCMPILWNDLFGETLVALFMATHCLLSCIFFFFIDVMSKRFNTRVTSQVSGLLHYMPTFTLIMFLSWVLFSGLPYTMKFLLEIGMFSILYNYNFVLTIITLLAMNIIGLMGFSKNMFNSLFGAPVVTDFIVYDLTKSELLLFVFFLTNLVALNSLTLIVW